jgi:hypothetical protein
MPSAKKSGSPTAAPSKATSAPKSVTVVCTKGKATKTVSGANPTCPSGYWRK